MKQDMIVILDLGSEENPRLAREDSVLWAYIAKFTPMTSPAPSWTPCPM